MVIFAPYRATSGAPSIDHLSLFRAAGRVGARVQPDLHNVGHRNATAAHRPAEHGFPRCRDSDVDVRRSPWGLQREAESLEQNGLQSFQVDELSLIHI